MIDFTSFTDKQVLDHLLEHFEELGAGPAEPGSVESWMLGIERGHISIEKRRGAFAMVGHANRKAVGGRPIVYSKEADLMAIMVSSDARGSGLGQALVRDVMARYTEDQRMELVCAGAQRRAFFEKAGFVFEQVTLEGLDYMFCEPIQ